jgi:hypothetical protein
MNICRSGQRSSMCSRSASAVTVLISRKISFTPCAAVARNASTSGVKGDENVSIEKHCSLGKDRDISPAALSFSLLFPSLSSSAPALVESSWILTNWRFGKLFRAHIRHGRQPSVRRHEMVVRLHWHVSARGVVTSWNVKGGNCQSARKRQSLGIWEKAFTSEVGGDEVEQGVEEEVVVDLME